MPTFYSRHMLLCFALLAPAVAAAQGPMNEGLWEITLRMEVAGQPATAAPMVVRQCITQQTAQELVAQLTGAGGGCQVSDLRQEANRTHWNMSCTGQIELTGSGEVTLSETSFDGTLNATIAMGGQAVPLQQTFSARRVGECK